MDKKEISISFLVSGLTILFLLASFALFLSKGRSEFWTAKKMKLGALILTLTVTTQSCNPFRTCYDPVPANFIELETDSDTINLNDSSNLSGVIHFRNSDKYSFKLQNDTAETVNQIEDIIPEDSVYDEETEVFTIQVDTSLKEGDYTLGFYDVKKEDQISSGYLINEYYFRILNDK